MKKLIIFGFDGTIADTSPGILFCLNTTAAAMGYTPVSRSALYGVIGNPLEHAFRTLYGMKEDEIEYAVNNYSKLYSQKGEDMLMIYDGLTETLKQLKESGKLLAIATQKHKMYTYNMLRVYKNIGEMFDIVCATDVDTNLQKRDMLLKVCADLGVSVEESILVGDSYGEAVSAGEIGMDFAAVLYGWGFRSEDDAKQYNCKTVINSASEIYRKLSVL